MQPHLLGGWEQRFVSSTTFYQRLQLFRKLGRDSKHSCPSALRVLHHAAHSVPANCDGAIVQVNVPHVESTDFTTPYATLAGNPPKQVVRILRRFHDLF